MQDARVRWALAGVCLIAFITSGIALWSKQRPAPPPIVIREPTPLASQGPSHPGRGGRKAFEGPAAPDAASPGTGTPPGDPLAPPSPPRGPSGAPVLGSAERGASGDGEGSPPRTGLLYVHVAGAVRHPSLYTLPPGSRVMQAVKAAGGPTPRADLDAINLAEKVTDGEKVYVPRRGQAPTAPPGNTLGYAPAPVAPTGPTAHGSAGGRPGKLRSPADGQVNLNTATAEELQRLPGVGPAMAARILAYRQQAGRFERPDDLMQVGGIGPKKFARLAPLVKTP